MIGIGTIGGIIVSLVICFGVPIIALVVLQIKVKKSVYPFVLGALAFTISQLVLRIPLLQYVLPQFKWYVSMQVNSPYLNWIFLGLTAGIFEEVARWIFIRFLMKKHMRSSDCLSFGIGHGGIEAMLLVGMNYVNLIILSFAINSGLSLTGTFGMTQGMADQVVLNLSALNFFSVILGGVERILAMIMHIAFTFVVFIGIKYGKSLQYLLLAIFLHGFVDASIGFWQAAGITGVWLEGIFAVYSGGLLLLIWFLKRKKEKEKEKESVEV